MLATKDGRFSRVAVFCDRRDKKDDGGGPSAQGVKEEIERRPRETGKLVAPRPRFIWSNCVRRQSFWDRRWIKIRESLAPLVCNIMRLADGAASGDWRLSVV